MNDDDDDDDSLPHFMDADAWLCFFCAFVFLLFIRVPICDRGSSLVLVEILSVVLVGRKNTSSDHVLPQNFQVPAHMVILHTKAR
jgi:hypothetical protein